MSILEELGSIVLDTRSLGRFSDAEFYQFCLDNRNLKFERDAQSNIIVMSNTGGKKGYYNTELLTELGIWNRKCKMGICFDSSTTFKLPNNAVRSPDAAWIRNERWTNLTDKEKEQFPPLCPDFVIEIKSASDVLTSLINKMNEWIGNGTRLAWLVNPEEKLTYVFTLDGAMHTVSFEEIVTGESILEGFEIRLSSVFK